MNKTPSILGGASIIAGVCIGAGMLGLPTAGAGAWTIYSSLAIIITMIVMTASGWLLLETFQHYDRRVSFDHVTKDLLGKPINFINNLAVYFVGAILLYAYTTTSGLMVQEMSGLNSQLSSILFVIVFSAFVWYSTLAVDRLSVLLVLFMILSFAFSISDMVFNIKLDILFNNNSTSTNQYAPYLLSMFPVALTSFGYHHSVASMRIYYGSEKRAQWAILGGTSIALLFYLLWIFSIFGNLPRANFAPIIAAKGDVNVLLNALRNVIDSASVQRSLHAFSVAAILSSFIGVGLGLMDFIADLFKFDSTRLGRTKAWGLTFFPPLIMSLILPFGFVSAIAYAGAVATIWTCIIPALLSFKAHQRFSTKKTYQVPASRIIATIVLIYGIIVFFAHFASMWHFLPEFKG